MDFIQIVDTRDLLVIDFDLVPAEEQEFWDYVIEEIGLRGDLFFHDFKVIRSNGNVFFCLVTNVYLLVFCSSSTLIKGRKFGFFEIDLTILKMFATEFPNLNISNVEFLDRLISKELIQI